MTRASESSAIAWVGTVLLGASALVFGALQVFLVPLRWGTELLGLSVVLAIVGNIALVWLARRGLDSAKAAVIVLGCWFVPVAGLAMVPRPEGDVLIPGGGTEQWVYAMTLLGGIVAGIVTLMVLDSGVRRRSINR